MSTENNQTQVATTVEQPIATIIAESKTKKTIKQYFEPLARVFTPNKSADNTTRWSILAIWLVFTLYFWLTSESRLLPTPIDLFKAAKDLFINHGLINHLLSSLTLAVKGMAYAIIICYTLATISTLQFFKPIAGFFSKARFLTTVGLSILFAQLTADTSGQKTALLVFGITVFLVTSFLAIIMDIRKEEYNYAKTLKMSNWRAYWEIVIIGKSDLFIDAIRQNFAIAWMMLPMVENICRVDGGIGIALIDQNKYFHLDGVYAIQIMVLFIGIGLDWFIGYMKGLFRPDTLIARNK